MNRVTMAARASANPTITGRFGTVRPPENATGAAYQGRQRKAPRLTSTQRNSQGRRSEWRLSPYAPQGGWR